MIEAPDYQEVHLSASDSKGGSGPSDKSWMTHSSNISVYDCLSSFSQEEMLCGNDKWYCPKCKDHQDALKKMGVHKPPEYLVIHFKRFSHTRSMMFDSSKIDSQIDFPIKSLDMTPYLTATDPAGSKEPPRRVLYDLYAVSNHYGSLNGGHYTAHCHSTIFKKWFEFDDSTVSSIDAREGVDEVKN